MAFDLPVVSGERIHQRGRPVQGGQHLVAAAEGSASATSATTGPAVLVQGRRSPTGVANSGTVNTGAFITGNDSNGILWRGNFEGLFSAYLGFTIEQFPLTYHAVGGIGPLHVAPVPISAAHFNITNASIGLGPFTIPEIHIPKIPIDVLGSVGLGQTTISDVTALNALNGGIGLSIGSFKFNDPFISIANFGNPNPPAIGFFISNLSITGPQISGLSIGSPIPLSLALGTTTWTLFPNGWTIPAQTPVTLGLSGGNDPFTFFPGGLTFPKASAGVINLSGGTDPFTLLPNGFQITTVPVLWDGTVLFGPIQIPIINVPPTPGFGNTTTTPSSGFFNSGDVGDRVSTTSVRRCRVGGTPRGCWR